MYARISGVWTSHPHTQTTEQAYYYDDDDKSRDDSSPVSHLQAQTMTRRNRQTSLLVK